MSTRNLLLPLLIEFDKGPLDFTPYGDPIVEGYQDIPGQEVRALSLFLSVDLDQLHRFVVVLIFQFGEFLSAHPKQTGIDEYNSIPASCLPFDLAAHTHTGFYFSQRNTAPGWYLAHVNTRNRNGNAVILIAPLPHCQKFFRILQVGLRAWLIVQIFSVCSRLAPHCLLVINIRQQNAFEHLHALKTSLLTYNPWYCRKPTLSPPVSGHRENREKG
jgi:hypothetical protein